VERCEYTCGISIDHKQKGYQIMFKHKNWFQRNRTEIGAGVRLISIFLLEIVVVIISTIGESIHTSIDEIDRERAKTWRVYKEGRCRE
jgi:hypothetical protein